jgi:hypothetical protein
MKSAIVLLSAVLFCILGSVVSLHAQSPATLPPPGIMEMNWVPISATAGVALSGQSTIAPGNRLDGLLSPGAERHAGILMVLHQGRWIAFDTLGDTSPQFRPLH